MTLIAVAALATLSHLAAADDPAPTAAPSIQGTYLLDYRELPDGRTFDKTGFTATRPGAFIDHWKKID